MSFMQIDSNINDTLKINLLTSADVVKYCFIAHKSLAYLDLSTNELTHMQRSVNTRESFCKLVYRRREVLYNYNLDLTKNLESSLKNVLNTEEWFPLPEGPHLLLGDSIDNAIYNIHIHVWAEVYTGEIAYGVVSAIESSSEKEQELKRYLKPIQTMNLTEHINRDELFHCYTSYLFTECKDSELVMECLTTFDSDFINWMLLENELTECLEYILHHAQKSKVTIWDSNNCPINDIIFFGRQKHIKSLLKFGTKHQFNLMNIKEILNHGLPEIKFDREDLCPSLFEDPDNTLKARSALLLQVFHVFLLQFSSIEDFVDGTEGLILIWRSIPNRFLSKEEILSTLKPTSAYYPLLSDVYDFYKDKVCEDESDLENSHPRTLSHLCRCTIRERLGELFELPGGISRLGLPTGIEKYLQLEH